MHMDRKLRIAIDCRIGDPNQGIGAAVLVLASALSDSVRTDQEYTFVIREGMQNWLAPYIYGPCSLAVIPSSASSRLKKTLQRIAPLRFMWRKLRERMDRVPVSDGYVESMGFDVVHFPTQSGYLTNLPYIYQPWDLQHVHYPQFFSKSIFAQRERNYRALCDGASFVCVQAQWTKRDVMEHYGIPEDRMVVVPWGSVFHAYKAPSDAVKTATAQKYGLPDQFFFYPAITWRHKNHELILRALHLLKSKYKSTPHVFFTGASTEYRATLEKLAKELQVSEQIHFLGFLNPEELQVIFRAATAMVFASKFEGFGLPILEAFHAELPVLSSKATTLPEIAQDGALYFDPNSPEELALLMQNMLIEPEVRQDLIRRGKNVLSKYSIHDTAASFQALYSSMAVRSCLINNRAPALILAE